MKLTAWSDTRVTRGTCIDNEVVIRFNQVHFSSIFFMCNGCLFVNSDASEAQPEKPVALIASEKGAVDAAVQPLDGHPSTMVI